jgi:predicted TIM-barrel fold metal-dependent hydrolase
VVTREIRYEKEDNSSDKQLAEMREALAADWKSYIETCIEAFGPDRCMFESNFPVDRFSLDYVTVWATFDLISSDYSQSERNNLFCNTALKTYQLN